MKTAQAALRAAIGRLRDAGVGDPAGDARHLLAAVLEIDRSRVTLMLPDPISEEVEAAFDQAIEKRANRQPVSHITGKRAFFGRQYRVTPDVLDPRPETELLVDSALNTGAKRILDLGTGSGAILISYLSDMHNAVGTGCDVSERALNIARENAENLGVIGRVDFVLSDWFSAITGKFDLIVSNPPYISEQEMSTLSPEVAKWEPEVALTPGGDGLGAYRIIVAQAKEFLLPKGWLMVEIGALQGKKVSGLFANSGFNDITILQDVDGRDRVVSGRRS